MSTRLSGLIPVLSTPFLPDLAIDLPSLRRLVEFQVGAGADGVATFGMASESFALTEAERSVVLTEVVSAADGLPVVAGVAATGLEPALAQVRQFGECGARSVMVLPPFLVRPGADQMVDFFGAIGQEALQCGVEVMVQDAQGVTGVAMPPALFAAFADLEGVTSAKIEAAPTVAKICQVGDALEGRSLDLFGGQNAQFALDELACGAVGTMPACEFTDMLAAILQEWTEGNLQHARAMFSRLLPLIVWGLQTGPAWSVHKEVLRRRGLITSAAVRPPAQPLPSRMLILLDDVLGSLDLREERA